VVARRSAIGRLSLVFLGGLIADFAVAFAGPWALSVLVGWDVAAAIFLVGVDHRMADGR
jgi:hypothetical protein